MKNTADVVEAAPGREENWQLQQIEVKSDPPPPFTSEPHFIANEAGEQNH